MLADGSAAVHYSLACSRSTHSFRSRVSTRVCLSQCQSLLSARGASCIVYGQQRASCTSSEIASCCGQCVARRMGRCVMLLLLAAGCCMSVGTSHCTTASRRIATVATWPRCRVQGRGRLGVLLFRRIDRGSTHDGRPSRRRPNPRQVAHERAVDHAGESVRG